MAETGAILFDIDGTLITTGGASDRAWNRAFHELYGIDVEVGDYTGRGVTDPVVGMTSFRGALGREPEDGEMDRLMALRLEHLPEEVESSPGYRVMPGVEALLERLAADGRLCGLITGNGSSSVASTWSAPAARSARTSYSPVATAAILIPAPCAASTSTGVSPIARQRARSSSPPAAILARSSALRATSTRSSASEP